MSELTIKAIQTSYKGYRFRSRLEARWAVFFDALGIKWEYEIEGYDLGEHGYYLPDFWLPQVSMWAEVKPVRFTSEQLAKCDALTRGTGFVCLFLDGTPDTRNYWSTEMYPGTESRTDFVMGEPHLYHLSEARFYSCTGCAFPDVEDCSEYEDLARAVESARSARFEHRERQGLTFVDKIKSIMYGDTRGRDGRRR